MKFSYITFFAFLFLMFLSGSRSLRAEIIDGQSCDPQMLEVIKKRAWLGGKREMEAAQTFILKADSVLELSCFTSSLLDISSLGSAWSNNMYDYGIGRINGYLSFGRDPGDIFIGLVTDGFYEYLGANFYHTLGGGTLPNPPTGTCTAMAAVWELVQCGTFEEDSFATLEQFTTTDPRVLPDVCTGYASTRMEDWVNGYNTSYPVPTAPPSNGSLYAVARDEYFQPFSADACDDVTPIPTGIIINEPTPGDYDEDGGEVKPENYEDKVCPSPGCSFQPKRITTEDDKCVF